MSQRRSRRHNPLVWSAVLVALVMVLNAAALIERLLGPLLMAVCVGVGAWAVARVRRLPVPPGQPPKVIRGQAEDQAGRIGHIARLEGENAKLRADLATAQDTAHAAWDQASEPPAQDPTVVDLRTRLLRDGRSGARPL
jgi:hypothetical protein